MSKVKINLEEKEKENNSSNEQTSNITDSAEVNKKIYFKTLIGVLIAFIIIVALFLIFSTIFAIVTSYNSTIISGVSIKDIDVSGLTKEQVLEKLSSPFNEKLSKEITLYHNEYETTVVTSQFGVSFDLEKAADMACRVGRTRKCF